jgi:hypothetical protein
VASPAYRDSNERVPERNSYLFRQAVFGRIVVIDSTAEEYAVPQVAVAGVSGVRWVRR